MISANFRKFALTFALVAASLLCLFVVDESSVLLAQERENSSTVRHVRALEMDELDIPHPAGLSFSPKANTFLVIEGRNPAQAVPSEAELYLLTPTEKRAGSARIGAQIKDPINTAFDEKGNRLLILKTPADQLIEVLAGPDGVLDPRTLTRYKVRNLGVADPQGMAVDPVSGHLFILDAAVPRVVRVEPDGNGSYKNGSISQIGLQAPGLVSPRGLAYDPTSGHLHLLSPTDQMLYELTLSGEVVSTRDVSEMGLHDPQAMVFVRSGDRTDDPAELSLYIADSGMDPAQSQRVNAAQAEEVELEERDNEPSFAVETRLYLPLIAPGSGASRESRGANEAVSASAQAVLARPGQIVELSFDQPAAVSSNTSVSDLVQTIDTSPWPSPDPAGITYLDKHDRLLVSDSEVNEMPIFTGDNLFEMDRSGALLDTLTTISFSDEPTGVTYNPANGHLFFSDDQGNPGTKSVYELNPGADGAYDTPDDVITLFSTQPFDSYDPEGITFDPIEGVLFIADGMNNEVYRVDPGLNGLFDGVPPTGDDQVIHFDTESLGIVDPEGIVFEQDSNNLYLVGSPVSTVAHVTREGALIRLIDISEANPVNSAGLAYAPSSLNTGARSLYVVDRGVDNDVDPNENDGKVYEMSIDPLTQGNTAPVVDAGADQTVLLPRPAKLLGTMIDDDRVPIAATTTWSQVSGPGSVTFGGAHALETKASFSLPGAYVLRLTADDGELTGSDEVTVTVTGEPAVAFLDVRITGTEVDNPLRSTDDAEEIDNATSSLDRFSGDLDFLFDRGKNRNNKIVGLRFNTVDIPDGAYITYAYVQFQVDETSLAATSLTVEGQADDNPATFGFSNKISPRPRTAANVSWSPPPWTAIGEAGFDQRTPNIASIIQEIADRDGWSSGNSMAILLSGTGERTAFAFEGDPAAAPLLHIEYQLTVPDVAGQAQVDAEAALVSAGLTVGEVTFANSGSVPAGNVISQDPVGGSHVAPGSAVALQISLGPVVVPDVVGLLASAAKAELAAVGLNVGVVTLENSDTVPADEVISQNPASGSQVAPGSAVDLVVSQGVETVIDLGEAGKFTILGLAGAKIKMEMDNPGVIGDVGLGPDGERELKDGFIAGTFFMDPTATTKELATVIRDGTVARDLSPAIADALRASSDAANLSPTQTYNEIKETRTIAADGKLTVVAVNKIELKDGKNLTLRGGLGDEFVINISEDLTLENGSVIQLDGGLMAGNVLFNFGKKDAKGEIKGGSSASGIFVAPGMDAVLKVEDRNSTVLGALIAGKEIFIKKDARVVSPGLETIIDLGEAGDFAVLGLKDAKIKMEEDASSVIGDVGLGPMGVRELKDGFIAGTFYMDPTATTIELKTVIEGGTVKEDLSPAVVDALLASSNAATLSPTQTYNEIKETRTIESDGALTVIEVNKIELNDGKILTLRGGAGDEFVINISENLKLDNGSMIRLDGGLQAGNVLFNFGKRDAKGEIKGGSSASGIFLAPGSDAVLKVEEPGSIVVGALIAGKEIAITKDAQLVSP